MGIVFTEIEASDRAILETNPIDTRKATGGKNLNLAVHVVFHTPD